MAVKLYSLGIFFYSLGIRIASFFNPKAKRFVLGRKHLIPLLKKSLDPDKERVLFHCASVGEFEQALPLWQKMKIEYPNYQYIFSFYSPSGYEYALQKHPQLIITYLPIDTQKKAKEFVQILQPTLAFFIKYEFWHHHLSALADAKTPVFLVSGIFRENQVFFKWYGSLSRQSLTYFTHFFVQNQRSVDLLKSLSHNNCSLSGDTRYERVLENKEAIFSDKTIEGFINQHKVLICGSIWQHDIPIIKDFLAFINNDWKVILVPHEPQHFKWLTSIPASKYSQSIDYNNQVLIIDQLGLLSKIYRLANIAYVGGGFGKGIHNILEAAIYKIPVIIGPNHKKFQEATDLIDAGQAFVTQQENGQEILRKALETQELTLEKSFDLMLQKANVSGDILVFIKKHCI